MDLGYRQVSGDQRLVASSRNHRKYRQFVDPPVIHLCGEGRDLGAPSRGASEIQRIRHLHGGVR